MEFSLKVIFFNQLRIHNQMDLLEFEDGKWLCLYNRY